MMVNIKKKERMKIVADNTGETTPFDWYNARLSVDFKVDKLADHAALTLTDHNGMVNGSNTLIKNSVFLQMEDRFMIATTQIIV